MLLELAFVYDGKKDASYYAPPLSGLTDDQLPYVYFSAEVAARLKQDESFSPLPGTGALAMPVDLDDQSGMFVDLLRHMERAMNFTCRLYTRKDQSWGTIKVWGGGVFSVHALQRTGSDTQYRRHCLKKGYIFSKSVLKGRLVSPSFLCKVLCIV